MIKKLMLCLVGMMFWSNQIQAAEDSLYDFHWLDPDKSVYVLQNKIHRKENRLTFDLGYISNITSEFQDTTGLMMSMGYFWHEEWGIELSYLNYENQNNSAFKNVKLSAGVEPFIRRHTSTMSLGIIWSPFYGKVNTFNKIYYFDWNIGVGLSQVNYQDNLRTSMAGSNVTSVYDDKKTTGSYLKTNVKFHLNESWNLGLGYQGTFFQAEGPESPNQKKWKLNNDIYLNVGFSY